MFDIVRRRLPIAMAAAVALALTGQAALAQSGDEISPSAIQSINVQKVDGRSAIKYNNDPSKRGGYLVAASADGYLPNNIIQKAPDSETLDGIDSTAFATIAALQSSAGAVNEADNPVHWNQIQGVPPKVLSGDTTRAFIAGESGVINPGLTGVLFVDAPVGLDVEMTLIPTTDQAIIYLQEPPPAFGNQGWYRNGPATLRHLLWFKNIGAVASTVKLRVTVWNDTYLSPAAARKSIKATFVENPKKSPGQLGQ